MMGQIKGSWLWERSVDDYHDSVANHRRGSQHRQTISIQEELEQFVIVLHQPPRWMFLVGKYSIICISSPA